MPSTASSSTTATRNPLLAGVFVQLAPKMAALDVFIRGQLADFEPEIRPMAAACLESSGKRLRPALVFLAGWPGDKTEGDLVRAAGVVEMVHLATLVHDDIMDRAVLRRGRPTAAQAYGPDAAVLLGDALFSQALHLAACFPTAEVCRLVAESTRRVCSGEIMQTLHRRELDITMAAYRRVIDLKTAELFRVSCRLGASLAGYGNDFVQAAADYGRSLGIAYQIYDDLADLAGDEAKIGKTLGTDLVSGKLTLPVMLLLERLPASEAEALRAAMRGQGAVPASVNAGQMRTMGIAREVAEAIEAEICAAEAFLAPHANVPAAGMLRQLGGLLREQVAGLQAG